ncbi:MAG: IS200/IS605 family transposase [Xenococcaceae cyanobacterium MO_188.B19]|nr:IS200/IS605 family transposase [Xenococcaceae cyanobacterium MO_188.B19]
MYRRERHSVTDLKIHLVCVTKYREDVFSERELILVDKVFREVAEKMNFQILEINGEKEHLHALIEYPPKLSVSKIVNALKGVSSRRYGQAGFRKPKNGKALWSPSYFAVSVGGAPIETLIKYIKEQSRPSLP